MFLVNYKWLKYYQKQEAKEEMGGEQFWAMEVYEDSVICCFHVTVRR